MVVPGAALTVLLKGGMVLSSLSGESVVTSFKRS